MLKFQLLSLIFTCFALASARYANKPKFFLEQNDEAGFLNNSNTIGKLPIYQIIESMESLPRIITTTEKPIKTSTTAATTTEDFRNADVDLDDDMIILEDGDDEIIFGDELPYDLLEIIHNKLRFKKFYKTPTTSEFGEFFGLTNADDIVQHIRDLIKTDEGAAMIKAYIIASDVYTNNFEKAETIRPKSQVEEASASNYENEQLEQCMNIRSSLLEQYNKELKKQQNINFNRFAVDDKRHTVLGDLSQDVVRAVIEDVLQTIPKPATQAVAPQSTIVTQIPTYIHHPLPYNYPVPLRSTTGKQQPLASPTTSHLNTPKEFFLPKELQNIAKMSPKKMQGILKSNPKLATLVSKIRSIPLSKETAALISSPMMAALQRALQDDEDLKTLLTGMESLK